MVPPRLTHDDSYLLYMSGAIQAASEGTIMQHVWASLTGA